MFPETHLVGQHCNSIVIYCFWRKLTVQCCRQARAILPCRVLLVFLELTKGLFGHSKLIPSMPEIPLPPLGPGGPRGPWLPIGPGGPVGQIKHGSLTVASADRICATTNSMNSIAFRTHRPITANFAGNARKSVFATFSWKWPVNIKMPSTSLAIIASISRLARCALATAAKGGLCCGRGRLYGRGRASGFSCIRRGRG